MDGYFSKASLTASRFSHGIYYDMLLASFWFFPPSIPCSSADETVLRVECCWDSDTNSVYLGKRSQAVTAKTVTIPTDDSKYIPKAWDKILCDDGYVYEITDVSRWENNVFSPGPLPDLWEGRYSPIWPDGKKRP